MFRIGFIISLALHLLVFGWGLLWLKNHEDIKQVFQKESHHHHGEVFKVTLKIKEERIPEIQKVIEKKLKREKAKKGRTVVKKATSQKRALVKKSIAQQKKEERLGKEELEAYIMELRHFIEKKKFYPRKAARLKQTGEVEIDIEIDQLGHFVSVDIKRASRFSSLNRAALRLAKEISKFKPLPQKMGDKITLSVPLKYQIK